MKQYLHNAEGRFWEAVHILDYHFLFIPLVFTLLRMWTCLVGILYVYIQIRQTPDWLNVTLVYLAVRCFDTKTLQKIIYQGVSLP